MVWQGRREVISGKLKKQNNAPNILIENNCHYYTEPDIANRFNQFFASVAEKTKAKIISTNTNYSEYLTTHYNNTMFLLPTTSESLNNFKAVGPQSIPTRILKNITPVFSKILSNIINECMVNGTFPSCLKGAIVIPIHKKDSKVITGNYRPISLLSNISKIFEKILHKRLYSFLDQQSIIYQKQYGFRKAHSTNHAITETIRAALDNNEFAVGIFVDLQKAFDTVDHKILLKKLEHYGVQGVANDLFALTYQIDPIVLR